MSEGFYLEFIIVGLIVLLFAIVGMIYLHSKNKRVSRFLEKFMDFLRYILGHV
jgi:uncharacterized protein (UPF0333 family)